MRLLLSLLCIISLSVHAQHARFDTIPTVSPDGSPSHYLLLRGFGPDTTEVARLVSITIRSTWWRHVDHHPFPVVLKEIWEPGRPLRYLKKMRCGWQPIPSYYKVWN